MGTDLLVQRPRTFLHHSLVSYKTIISRTTRDTTKTKVRKKKRRSSLKTFFTHFSELVGYIFGVTVLCDRERFFKIKEKISQKKHHGLIPVIMTRNCIIASVQKCAAAL